MKAARRRNAKDPAAWPEASCAWREIQRPAEDEEGPQAATVKATVRRLFAPLGIPVAYHDERLTSTEANRAMAAAGADERARRGSVDMVAASLLLQSYLDAHTGHGKVTEDDR